MKYPLPNLPAAGRGSGRTTRQLQALPIGGWYFCHDPRYMKILAKAVDRSDIEFHSAKELFDADRFSGYIIPGIDVDHYVWENYEPNAIIESLKKLEPCVLRAQSPKSAICPCGIDRRDCEYHND